MPRWQQARKRLDGFFIHSPGDGRCNLVFENYQRVVRDVRQNLIEGAPNLNTKFVSQTNHQTNHLSHDTRPSTLIMLQGSSSTTSSLGPRP